MVVVSRGGQVTQKVVDAGEELRPDDLVQAANYLNTEFAGLPLLDVRDAVLARLRAGAHASTTSCSRRALRLAQQTLEDAAGQQAFHVEGAASLLDEPVHEGVSLATLRALLEMMEEKERMVHLLNQYIDGPGLTVVIGAEHTAPDLRPFSLIASTGGRRRHAHGRRHRPDAHALFARDRARGRDDAGRVARPAGRELTMPRRPRTMERRPTTNRTPTGCGRRPT